MGRSEEFNRDGEADVEKVVKSVPVGLLPLMVLIVSVLIIIAGVIWWLS